MAKVVETPIAIKPKRVDIKEKIAELLDTQNAMLTLRQLNMLFPQQEPQQQQQNAQQPDLSVLGMLDYLKQIPEEDRPLALELIKASKAPPAQQSTSLDPTLLLLLTMLNKDGKKESDNSTTLMIEAMKQQYSILAEIIKAMGSKGDGNNLTGIAELIKALKETANNSKDEMTSYLAKMAIDALTQAALSKDTDGIEEHLKFLEKLQSAGLLVDPKTTWEYTLKKEQIDREFKLKERQIEIENQRLEKVSEFLAEMAQALSNLSEEEKKDIKTEQRLTVNCPECGKAFDITEDMIGSIVECPHCSKKLKISMGGR